MRLLRRQMASESVVGRNSAGLTAADASDGVLGRRIMIAAHLP
jgi:hypothetical protein